MLSCFCSSLSDSDIRKLIEDGLTKDEIIKQTGMTVDCGSCYEDLVELINEAMEEED